MTNVERNVPAGVVAIAAAALVIAAIALPLQARAALLGTAFLFGWSQLPSL